jgi:hypothetical protein
LRRRVGRIYWRGWMGRSPCVFDSSGQKYIFPDVDLQSGDTVIISAENKECTNQPVEGKYVTKMTIKYDYNQIPASNHPKEMKYFFI